MVNHIFSLIVLVLLLINTVLEGSPLEMIFKNRCHILNVRNQLNFKEASLDTTPVTATIKCTSKPGKKIEELIDSSYSCWKNNEEVVLVEFMNWYIPYVNRFKKFHYYIQDSITVSILITFLDYPDYRVMPEPKNTAEELAYMAKPKLNWARDALNTLTYRVYFSEITKQSSEIIKHLSKCREPEINKLKLFALCDLSRNEMKNKRDSILNRERYLDSLLSVIKKHQEQVIMKFDSTINRKNNKVEANRSRRIVDSLRRIDKDTIVVIRNELDSLNIIPLWVKARLGVISAEKTIIKSLKYKRPLTELLVDASFVWSDSCKKVFLSLFEKDYPLCPPSSYITNSGAILDAGPRKYETCRSLQDSLLIYLARHHPDDAIFGNILSANRNNADFCNPEEQVPYFITFAVWVKKNYGCEISYKDFKPYFIKDISKDQSAVREICKEKH